MIDDAKEQEDSINESFRPAPELTCFKSDERKKFDAVATTSNLARGQRNLLNYCSYFCRKYGVREFANCKSFRQNYINYLIEYNVKVVYTDGTINKYFNDLIGSGILVRPEGSKRKYFRVKEEFFSDLLW
jgi:hypothetical protein